MSGESIYVFGAGGHAREILQIIQDINASAAPARWQPAGILLDPEYSFSSPDLHGIPILSDPAQWNPELSVVIAVGQSAGRWKVYQRLLELGFTRFPALIRPRAWLAASTETGQGNVIFAGAMLNTDVTLGDHVHINLGSSVSHDTRIADFATIGPGCHVCGNCRIGAGADLGAACTLIPKASLGDWTITGAASVVVGDIAANTTAIGTPATVIKSRQAGWHTA